MVLNNPQINILSLVRHENSSPRGKVDGVLALVNADRLVGESMPLGVAHAVGRESCGHHVACRVGGRDRTECSRVGHEGASVSKVRPVAAAACDVVPLLVWHVLGFLKPNRRSNSVRRNSAGAGDIEATAWRSRGGVRAAHCRSSFSPEWSVYWPAPPGRSVVVQSFLKAVRPLCFTEMLCRKLCRASREC